VSPPVPAFDVSVPVFVVVPLPDAVWLMPDVVSVSDMPLFTEPPLVLFIAPVLPCVVPLVSRFSFSISGVVLGVVVVPVPIDEPERVWFMFERPWTSVPVL
jgi:hypothetical protein